MSTDHIANVLAFLKDLKREEIGGIAFSLVKPNGDVAQMSALTTGSHIPILGMLQVQQHQIVTMAMETMAQLPSASAPQDLN